MVVFFRAGHRVTVKRAGHRQLLREARGYSCKTRTCKSCSAEAKNPKVTLGMNLLKWFEYFKRECVISNSGMHFVSVAVKFGSAVVMWCLQDIYI